MNNNICYINTIVEVKIDRPLGSKHPKHDFIYKTNYGFIPETTASDGDEIDAYVLGVNKPLKTFKGKVIAVIQRINDDDDKLIVVPGKMNFSNEEMAELNLLTQFSDQVLIHKISLQKSLTAFS